MECCFGTTSLVEKIEKRKEELRDSCSARSIQLSGETTRQLDRKRLHVEYVRLTVCEIPRAQSFHLVPESRDTFRLFHVDAREYLGGWACETIGEQAGCEALGSSGKLV